MRKTMSCTSSILLAASPSLDRFDTADYRRQLAGARS
jgi:hypothetical protein